MPVLRRLLERDSNLYRSASWYTKPIHFAVREGHCEAVQILLDAGASWGPSGGHSTASGGGRQKREVIDLLLDRGADIDALHGQGLVSERGYAAGDFQPIDLALWTGSRRSKRRSCHRIIE